MRSLKWEKNTLQSLSNVEKGLTFAHEGVDKLQRLVDEARELMATGDHEGVQLRIKKIHRALGVFVPLRQHRESDPNLRPWEV